MIAATSPAHGISTGMPELTTTTVLALAAATRLTSSSCRPGSAIVSLSYPSLSAPSGEPTTTTATSASAAACTASWSRLSSSTRGVMPRRMAAKPPCRPRAFGPCSKRTSTSRPALSCNGTRSSGGRDNASTTSRGGRFVASASMEPSTPTRSRPTPETPRTYAPSTSGRYRARRTTTEPGRCNSSGRPSHHVTTLLEKCASWTIAPSAVRTSRCTPSSPLTGSRRLPCAGEAVVALVRQPWCTLTLAALPSAARSDFARSVWTAGRTRTLPPPWVCGSVALGPISATLRGLPLSRGSKPRGLLSRTNDRAVTSRRRCESTSAGPVGE